MMERPRGQMWWISTIAFGACVGIWLSALIPLVGGVALASIGAALEQRNRIPSHARQATPAPRPSIQPVAFISAEITEKVGARAAGMAIVRVSVRMNNPNATTSRGSLQLAYTCEGDTEPFVGREHDVSVLPGEGVVKIEESVEVTRASSFRSASMKVFRPRGQR